MLGLNNLTWYEISDTEEQAVDNQGNIYTREKNIDTLPLYCNICDNMIATVEDIETMKNIGCCTECEIVYYYPNKQKWDNGWRPKK